MRRLLLLLAALACAAQQEAPDGEQAALRSALAEAGSSPVDFMRALEGHLEKYPKTTQRAEIERALVKSAIENRDSRRLLKYGERVLSQDPENLELADRLSRTLLAGDPGREQNERALDYARRMEKLVRDLPKPAAGRYGAGRATEQQQLGLGKALVYQSRALGNLGKLAEAEALARKSYDAWPSAESAREIARWLDRQGKTEPAIAHQADAFAIADPAADEEDRKKDRTRLGEWWRKAHGSEAGLGDAILAAFDRTQALLEKRRAALKQVDPNASATHPLEFTISGVDGQRLPLANFRGKVVVFDFWATWCGPCRAQQPLYEEVKQRFQANRDVVFLNVNTDENREVVKPFLDQMKWNKTIYFEDGLSSLFRVSSIPTTVVMNRRGEVTSRMNGYIADRFVDMLSDRIRQSLEDR